jgi:uncharacterized protein (DUF302 family)
MKKFTYIITLLLLSNFNIAIAEDKVSEKTKSKVSGEPVVKMYEVGQTVLRISLKKGVSANDAIMAMNSKAADLNMRLVGQQNVSAQLRSRGISSRRLEIFQYCNPEDAIKMVEFNPIYAAYMPCRISVVEDEKGEIWLLMLNLDMIINKFPLPEELRTIAITINATMLEIITAGSTGEF